MYGATLAGWLAGALGTVAEAAADALGAGVAAPLQAAKTIATVPYGSFAIGAVAKTLELKVLTYAGAQTASSWCAAATPWATGSDNGTPGAVGDCP